MEEEIQVRDLIIKMRKESGLSKTDMGKLIGVAYTKIARWEKGDVIPHATVLFRMANALGKDISVV